LIFEPGLDGKIATGRLGERNNDQDSRPRRLLQNWRIFTGRRKSQIGCYVKCAQAAQGCEGPTFRNPEYPARAVSQRDPVRDLLYDAWHVVVFASSQSELLWPGFTHFCSRGPVRDFPLIGNTLIDYLDHASERGVPVSRKEVCLSANSKTSGYPPMKDLPPNCLIVRFKMLGREFCLFFTTRRCR
jgi:hypothetical protein